MPESSISRFVIPVHTGIQLYILLSFEKGDSMTKHPCAYILASKRNGTLYTGVTSDLIKRVWEHKQEVVKGFTSKHHIHMLVWYELHESMISAIEREKSIKNWTRQDKLKLIESTNSEWVDLYSNII
jgi:putative endonuclease